MTDSLEFLFQLSVGAPVVHRSVYCFLRKNAVTMTR